MLGRRLRFAMLTLLTNKIATKVLGWPPLAEIIIVQYFNAIMQYFRKHYCHTRAPSWILSQAENLASFSLQDGAT